MAMVEDRSADWRQLVPATDAVTASLGEAYWSVQRHSWSGVRPDLPPELADLVAPPVVVGAARVTRRTAPRRATRPGRAR